MTADWCLMATDMPIYVMFIRHVCVIQVEGRLVPLAIRDHPVSIDFWLGASHRLHSVYWLLQAINRPFNYAIVDEVDSILIDDCRNPMLITGSSEKAGDRYKLATEVGIISQLITIRRR